MVNVINFYLDPEKPDDVQVVCARSKPQGALDPKDEALLQGYVLEANRKSSASLDEQNGLMVYSQVSTPRSAAFTVRTIRYISWMLSDESRASQAMSFTTSR